jgi:NADPH-dependent curcumin reductase CurA
MTTSRARLVLAARPKGKPDLTDFRLGEITIPMAASGQLLLGVQYLSLDPYMRGRMDDPGTSAGRSGRQCCRCSTSSGTFRSLA